MKQIYIFKDGQQKGPYSIEFIGQLVQEESITGEDLFWYEGAVDWRPVSELPEYVAPSRSHVASPPLPPHAGTTSSGKTSESTEEHSIWHYLGQGAAACVLVSFAVNFLFSKGCSSQSARPMRVTEGVATRPVSSPLVEPSVELLDFSTSWVNQSRGMTTLDGKIWVPQVKTTVKNLGDADLPSLVIRVAFINDKGVITSDSKEWIRDLPAGYAKGPFFIKGTVGYTNDWAFVDMANDDKKKWKYDLFYSTSYNGPWKKVRSENIAPPEQYGKIFK
jgi:hypothetical protein